MRTKHKSIYLKKSIDGLPRRNRIILFPRNLSDVIVVLYPWSPRLPGSYEDGFSLSAVKGLRKPKKRICAELQEPIRRIMKKHCINVKVVSMVRHGVPLVFYGTLRSRAFVNDSFKEVSAEALKNSSEWTKTFRCFAHWYHNIPI